MIADPAARQRPTLGGWLAIPEPVVVEAAGRAGFDWVGLDLQHGAWDLGTAFRAIQLLDALGMPVLVRLSEEELALIPRVLDHGASGVVLAMVSSPQVAAAAIVRARYQPEGLRSFGGQRYGMGSLSGSDPSEIRPAIYAMIEDRRGYDSVAAIAAVPGLAGLHIGPVDLGLALGLGTNRSVPAFTDALRNIVAAGHAAGVSVTMHAISGARAREMLDLGFDELVLTADIELLRTAFDQQIAAARAAAGP
jgi:4-hydroxy-2-oxoheptanedioate aldolase